MSHTKVVLSETEMNEVRIEQGFSVEMKSKKHMRSITMSESDREGVLFEGVLGVCEELGVLEEAVLMVMGAHGTLRFDQKERGLSQAMVKDKTATEGSR